MIVWAGWTLLLLTDPGMSRGPSALQVSFARWLPPNILLHFYCPNLFHRPFSGNPRYLVKIPLRSKLYFCGDLKWMSRSLLLESTSRPVLSFKPFFVGPCPVLPLYDKNRCGENEKMLILSEMIVVGWRTMVGHDDWPEFEAGEWWQQSVCCFDWEWSMCAIFCPAWQCISMRMIILQNCTILMCFLSCNESVIRYHMTACNDCVVFEQNYDTIW